MKLKNILNFLSLVSSLESDLHSVHFSEVKSRIDEKLDASMRKLTIFRFNSQAPDVPDFSAVTAQRELLCQNGEKYPLYFNRTNFMPVLSVPQDPCESQNNFMKFFFEFNYTLHGVHFLWCIHIFKSCLLSQNVAISSSFRSDLTSSSPFV